MPDSPKCKECEGQTFKVAGKPLFKCHNCGKVFNKDSFTEADFTWKKPNMIKPKPVKKWKRRLSEPSK